METVKLNPAEFVGKQAACKIGNIYPNLPSQASYINKDIEKVKEGIVDIVEQLHTSAGMDNAKLIIDAMDHRVENEITLSKDCDECGDHFTKETVREMSNDVYALGEMAKSLIDLSKLTGRLQELDERAELTKKNVLL